MYVVNAGGHGLVETIVKSSFMEKHGYDIVKDNIGYEFKYFKGKGESERKKSGLSPEWYSDTSVRLSVEGGDPIKGKFETYEPWKATIVNNPIKVGYTLTEYFGLITDPVIRENAKKAVIEYHRRHQKKENIPRVIYNCKHIELAKTPPPKTVKVIGWHRYCLDIPDKVFLVDGPDPNDECLASLHYIRYDILGNPKDEYRIENVIMSPTLRIYSIGILECMKRGTEKLHYAGSKAVFADGNSCMAASGVCDAQFKTEFKIPNSYKVDIQRYAKLMPNPVCQACNADTHATQDHTYIAYVTQRRLY